MRKTTLTDSIFYASKVKGGQNLRGKQKSSSCSIIESCNCKYQSELRGTSAQQSSQKETGEIAVACCWTYVVSSVCMLEGVVQQL